MPKPRGNKNQVLTTGRLAYGSDGTDDIVIRTDANGNIILGAGTASAGTVAVSNTETIETELFAAASVAASSQALSSTISFAGVKKAIIFIDHARSATAAFGTNGTEYRIEVSQKATGNETWRPIASVLASSAVCASAAASSDCAAGTTLVTITSGTAMTRGDIICFTSGTIEWVRATAVTGTASFAVQDATTYGHASATGLFGGAEHFALTLNTESVTRGRVVVNNNASGTTIAVFSRIACITEK